MRATTLPERAISAYAQRAAEIRLPGLHAGQREIVDLVLHHEKIVIRAGRRFGKSTVLEWIAAKAAIGRPGERTSGLRVGWFGPDFRRNRPSFDRLARLLAPLTTSRSATFLSIELASGGGIEFWTLGDENAGRSRVYDLVIIDEATLAIREITPVWEQSIRPTLIDRGGVAIMAGTPKGIQADQLFYRACNGEEKGWVEYHAPTTANPFLREDELERLPLEYPPLVYQQEILAEFVDWRGAPFFSEDAWLVDGKAVPMPSPIDRIYATIDTAMKSGREHDGTAVVYFAKNRLHDRKIYVLDWDVVHIAGNLLIDWYPSVLRRMQELSDQCRARYEPRGPFVEDASAGTILIQQAIRQRMPVEAIHTKLTSVGKDERALSTVSYHASRLVAITEYAANKSVNWNGSTRNHFMSQVIGYRPGLPMSHDDLLDCYTYGLSLGLGDGSGW